MSAMIDNHIYWGTRLKSDLRRVDLASCRQTLKTAPTARSASLGVSSNGFTPEGVDITVASEVMAILCLAKT